MSISNFFQAPNFYLPLLPSPLPPLILFYPNSPLSMTALPIFFTLCKFTNIVIYDITMQCIFPMFSILLHVTYIDVDLEQVKDYLHRFANIPDVLELDHLTVSGDVTFGKNVTLKVRFKKWLNRHEKILQLTKKSHIPNQSPLTRL